MAANKFATMLHRNNTPKIAIILIYTLLEWTLIALLLFNGLFSYLISRFAKVFGLKPPCIFCSRLDHLFGRRESYSDLICDEHAAEVSTLGYCSSHRNLAEESSMRRSERGEKGLRCSCCDVILESGLFSPYLVIKPSSWGVLEFSQKGKLDEEEEKNGFDDNLVREDVEGEVREREEKELDENRDACVKVVDDESLELLTPMRRENGLLGLEERLVPVELIDSSTLIENKDDKVEDERDYVGYNLVEKEEEEKVALLLSTMEINKIQTLPVVNDVEEECFSADHQCGAPQSISISEQELDDQVEAEHAEGFGEFQASEENGKVMDAEANCEISIGSEICDHELIELPHFNELACTDEQCSASYNVIIDKQQVIEAEPVEETIARSVNELSICTQRVDDVEDDRMPETPTSIDGLIHAVHKRFMFERRESGTESLDGSVASEIDGNEILTIDHLKASLRAERKALSALYAELEEERSASAIAANQTMAMITRLQEEKAAVQMEALQYQRMMEEQSEYDQEALQVLNELMMKREKEKQELERELDVYRKKVLLYEAKERRKLSERSKINGNGNVTSSASSSAGDSDDLSFESHEGDDCNYRHNESNQNTSTDDVLSSGGNQEASKHLITLDESLAVFEEERLSILEQLRALEEKLFSMDDDEFKPMGHQYYSNENGHGLIGDDEFYGDDLNGNLVNGFDHDLDTNGKLHQKPRTVASGGKRLLPLFDATIGMESEDGISLNHETTNDSPQSVSNSALDDHKRLAIAEEVNNVYERLQALEADREFLKHCIRSLKKGDKGMDLLQEILQHLRDLRNVDLHMEAV